MMAVNLFILLLFTIAISGSAFAVESVNISVTDNSGAIIILAGNFSRNYTLQVNISNTTIGYPENLSNVNVTFYLPYGLEVRNATGQVNLSVCNGAGGFAKVNRTYVSCEVSVSSAGINGTLMMNLTFTHNVSAFPKYGAYIINYTVTCSNCTPNSTSKIINVTNYFLNPRPEALQNGGSSTVLLFTFWNQSETSYKLPLPIYNYNPALGRPELANNTFGQMMFFDKSVFEFPSYMKMWSYNLSFKLIFDGDIGNAAPVAYTIRSPVDSEASPEQTLIPMMIMSNAFTDFMTNNSVNMTIGLPATQNFNVFYNKTSFTDSTILQQRGINITFNVGNPLNMQNNTLLTLNFTNITLANNTEITILFTLINKSGLSTGDQSGINTTSPLYINNQRLSGWGFDQPPKFGSTTNISYTVNLTNKLSNYSVTDLSVSFMQPMNVTMNISGTVTQFNMTRNPVISLWNGTDWLDNLSVTKTESSINFIDRTGPTGGGNITVYITTWDVSLSNNAANMTLKGWRPNQNAYALLNFTSELTFPVISETSVPSGSAGTSNSYNATVQVTQRAPLNITDKVPGLNENSTNINVTIDGIQIDSSNLTIGSLIVDDVGAGTHTVSVKYTVPAAASSSASSSSSSAGGGSGTATVQHVQTFTSVTADSINTVTVKSSSIAIKTIEFSTSAPAEDVKFTVKPIGTQENEPGIVYQRLDITTVNLNNLKNAKVKFNTTKKWLDDNNFIRDEVSLYRLENNAWRKLTTSVFSESSDQVEYESIVPGFSVFIIAGEKIQAAPAQVEPPTTLCGNYICEADETESSCPTDCSTELPIKSVCGNGICEPDESIAICAIDCSPPEKIEKPSLPDGIVLFIALIILLLIFYVFSKFHYKGRK